VTGGWLAYFFFAAIPTARFKFADAITFPIMGLLQHLGTATTFTDIFVGVRITTLITNALFHTLLQRFALSLLKICIQ